MKLYFSPGACSLSPHIVLLEAGLPFQAEQVDLGKKTTAGGADFRSINPKGYVPALVLDDGSVLTEAAVIVQYIADLAPQTQLAPAAGTLGRYRVMEWLNYLASEIHKNFGPLFRSASEEQKNAARANLHTRLGYIAGVLEGQAYLDGERFGVADSYLFTMLNWCPKVEIDLAAWPSLTAFQERIAARPAVQRAMGDEGLLA